MTFKSDKKSPARCNNRVNVFERDKHIQIKNKLVIASILHEEKSFASS